MMSLFSASFGSNSIKNNVTATIDKNAVITAPAFVMSGLFPGYYTITMICMDAPFAHYIKCNVYSNGKSGSVVLNYQGPPPEIVERRNYVITCWRQPARISPPPRAPVSRARFSIENFVARYALLEIKSIHFRV